MVSENESGMPGAKHTLPSLRKACSRRERLWQDIHDLLRDELRVKEGREASPSAAVIDSQSVKTTEKRGSAVTMPARRARVASAILS